ncbi:MAG: response regulator [Candidatus Binatia bacterium]
MAETILVVEDQPIIRKCICDALQKVGGYRVDEAGDGAQALELINARRFDLVISDFVMPRLDGVELLEHLRSVSPKTQIIFITGYFSKDSLKAFLPGVECVTKPFGVDDLMSVVQRLLPPNGRQSL